ncbi:hypothetical protein M1293_00330 [Candidatus Parvarchaeota archaeon]|nr:hypothetical protein [Candidatus Parvarchaeota archaeon]
MTSLEKALSFRQWTDERDSLGIFGLERFKQYSEDPKTLKELVTIMYRAEEMPDDRISEDVTNRVYRTLLRAAKKKNGIYRGVSFDEPEEANLFLVETMTNGIKNQRGVPVSIFRSVSEDFAKRGKYGFLISMDPNVVKTIPVSYCRSPKNQRFEEIYGFIPEGELRLVSAPPESINGIEKYAKNGGKTLGFFV